MNFEQTNKISKIIQQFPCIHIVLLFIYANNNTHSHFELSLLTGEAALHLWIAPSISSQNIFKSTETARFTFGLRPVTMYSSTTVLPSQY